jgi:hypothetical protein
VVTVDTTVWVDFFRSTHADVSGGQRYMMRFVVLVTWQSTPHTVDGVVSKPEAWRVRPVEDSSDPLPNAGVLAEYRCRGVMALST